MLYTAEEAELRRTMTQCVRTEILAKLREGMGLKTHAPHLKHPAQSRTVAVPSPNIHAIGLPSVKKRTRSRDTTSSRPARKRTRTPSSKPIPARPRISLASQVLGASSAKRSRNAAITTHSVVTPPASNRVSVRPPTLSNPATPLANKPRRAVVSRPLPPTYPIARRRNAAIATLCVVTPPASKQVCVRSPTSSNPAPSANKLRRAIVSSPLPTTSNRKAIAALRPTSVDIEEIPMPLYFGLPDGLRYPFYGRGAVTIGPHEMAKLSPNSMINDNLIEFGLQLWYDALRERDAALADQVHIFSPFFYEKLTASYEAVKAYTKNVDIFSKAFLIVPIHDKDEQHWYLAIITNPRHILEMPVPPSGKYGYVYSNVGANFIGWTVDSLGQHSPPRPESTVAHDDSDKPIVHGSKILIFDSLNRPRLRTTPKCTSGNFGTPQDPGDRLLHYLCAEASRTQNIEPAPSRLPACFQVKIPMQCSLDCGLHVLHIAEVFVENADALIRKIWTGENDNLSDACLNATWQADRPPRMRQILRTKILALADEWRRLDLGRSVGREEDYSISD